MWSLNDAYVRLFHRHIKSSKIVHGSFSSCDGADPIGLLRRAANHYPMLKKSSPPSGPNFQELLMRLTPSDTVDLIDLNRTFRRPSSSHEERILRRNLPLARFCEDFALAAFSTFSTESRRKRIVWRAGKQTGVSAGPMQSCSLPCAKARSNASLRKSGRCGSPPDIGDQCLANS